MSPIIRRFVLLLSILGVLSVASYSRIIGTNPTGSKSDLWCNGGRIRGGTSILLTEDCQDYQGNWIPTTASTSTLGTSALPWLNLYATTVTPGSGGVVIPVAAPLVLPPNTTTQIATYVFPIGSLVTAQESVGGSLVTNLYNVCQSTKAEAGDFVYVIVTTSALAAVGQKCNN